MNQEPTIPTKIFRNAQWILKCQSANKRKSPNYPCKRWGHTAVLNDKFMYIFSGCGKSDNVKQWEQIYRMDCTTFSWERLNSPSIKHPSARDSHSCVCVENQLYFFGGSSNDLIMGDFWSFDIDTFEWNEIIIPKEMVPREGHSMVTISERLIYIYGGWDSSQNLMTDTHWLFDTISKTFCQVTNISGEEMNKLESHSAIKIGDSIYIFGGIGQGSGKQQIFYKDLYKIDFEGIDDKNEDNQILMNNIALKIEKVKINGAQQPTPRASHSAINYADRFLFIIGGEGYQYDQVKDIEEEKGDQEQEDQQVVDEEEKPIFPKNDIWIFETIMKTWSKLTPKSKQPAFQPRFSHSCVVYKDQLIIFGGLRSMGEVLEDIMVLHLKDSENQLQKFQRDEMKNVCKYCQLIYGIQQEEDISFQKTAENNSFRQVKVSLSFIDELSKMIQSPMSCFGLFLDNARLSKANSIKINYTLIQKKKKYQNTIEEVQEKIPVITIFENNPFDLEDFSDFLFNFETPIKKFNITQEDKEAIQRNGGDQLLQDEEYLCNRKQYSINFKLASLRLGESALICHKSSNIYNVALLTMNSQLNPNQESLTIYSYSITTDKKVDCFESQYVLTNAVNHLFTEEDYILNQPGNYTKILIFDLMRIHEKQKLYELNSYNDDILLMNYINLGLKKEEACLLPDFSVKEYVKINSIVPFQSDIIIQGQVALPKQQSIKNKMEAGNKIEVQDPSLKEKIAECVDEFWMGKFKGQNQGILLYADGRLINRYQKPLGTYTGDLEYTAYLSMAKFMVPNLIKEGFQSSYLYGILCKLLEKVQEEAEQEPPIRKQQKQE